MTVEGTPAKNPPKEVRLTCHHVTHFRAPHPEPGDVVWCRRCQEYRTVAGQWFQYQLRCDKCRVNRSYGQDLERARHGARNHTTQRPTHTVSIKVGGRVVETVTWQGIQEPLTGL